MLRILATGGFRGAHRPKQEGRKVPRAEAPVPLPRLRAGKTSVTWVGHATALIRTGGKNFLTDPVWSPKLPGGIRRITEPGLDFEALPDIHGILVSHDHYDHLDARTMRRFDRTVRVLCPANLGRWFTRRGFKHVVEMDWWSLRSFGGVEVTFVPAQHWSRRGPFDLCRSLWGGWVLRPVGGEATFFAGDTGYGPHFRQIGEKIPRIGTAIMPVGAYQPRWFMAPVHTDPEEAVQAALDVGARRIVPIHYGTFVLSREPVLEPLHRARDAWLRAGRKADDFWGLALGETRTA
jgi:L-ascorbate metabolism protein UlaG (beta-lactamase superfamily)